jgi:hypothetical protein
MTFTEAMKRLRLLIAKECNNRAGVDRREIAEGLARRMRGTDEWLSIQAALGSELVIAKMMTIAQQLGRSAMKLPPTVMTAEGDRIEIQDDLFDDLPALRHRILVRDEDGRYVEIDTHSATGRQAKQYRDDLHKRALEDLRNVSDFDAWFRALPEWEGDVTFDDALAMHVVSEA